MSRVEAAGLTHGGSPGFAAPPHGGCALGWRPVGSYDRENFGLPNLMLEADLVTNPQVALCASRITPVGPSVTSLTEQLRPADAHSVEVQAGSLSSYVDGDDWVCVFCTCRNPLEVSHCLSCRLSYRAGVPRELETRRQLPAIFSRASSPMGESTLAVSLFAIWKLGDVASGTNTRGAVDRGRYIWNIERQLGLPSEAAAQRLVLPLGTLVHVLDGYYAVAHLGGMAALAGWLYSRHRASYARWRNAVVATTLVCFALQLVSVAPPRLVPGVGIIDTARRDGESVYGSAHFANQVSSMPSVHMAWAILIASAVCTVGRGHRRWLSVLHPILTLGAIVLTGNHYWLDAVAAGVTTMASLRLTRASCRSG